MVFRFNDARLLCRLLAGVASIIAAGLSCKDLYDTSMWEGMGVFSVLHHNTLCIATTLRVSCHSVDGNVSFWYQVQSRFVQVPGLAGMGVFSMAGGQ